MQCYSAQYQDFRHSSCLLTWHRHYEGTHLTLVELPQVLLLLLVHHNVDPAQKNKELARIQLLKIARTRLMYLAMDFLTTLILESLEAAPPVTWKSCLMREKIKIGIK